MNRNLAVLLGLSLALNLYLGLRLGHGGSSPAAPPTRTTSALPGGHPPAAGGQDATADEGGSRPHEASRDAAALQARVAALEAEVQAVRAEADQAVSALRTAEARMVFLEGMDPIGAIVHSGRPLREKLRAIAALPDGDRESAEWALGRELSRSGAAAAEVLDALRAEDDPKILRTLAGLAHAGALCALAPGAVEGLLEVLRCGEPAERRLAAAWGLRWPDNRATLPVLEETVTAAVRSERDDRVVGALAEALSDGPWFDSLSGSAVPAALSEVADRLPAGEGRRQVLVAIGRADGSGLAADGTGLFLRFAAATTQDLRDDVAYALARCANSGFASFDEDGAQPAESRRRFLDVYRGTSVLRTRQELVRGAYFGLGLLSLEGEEAAGLLREVAGVEQDPQQRERLGSLAAATAAGSLHGSGEVDRILYGRE